MLRVPQKTLRTPEVSMKLEWLETNGLGGYASQTVLGSHSRGYHGLLTASLKPPTNRYVLLSKYEEEIVIDSQRIAFSVNDYGTAIHPRGYGYMTLFHLDPLPTWEYRFPNNVVIHKTIFMTHGKNETTVIYRIIKNPKKSIIKIILKPLIAFRDMHDRTTENATINTACMTKKGALIVHPYEQLPAMSLFHNGEFSDERQSWYKHFHYAIEEERGYPAQEDLFNTGEISFPLSKNEPAFVVANLDLKGTWTAKRVKENEKKERARRTAVMTSKNDFVRSLRLAADQFIVDRSKKEKTIIAGYPWFTDWGRDSMISLPGLLISQKRFAEAKNIIRTFLDHAKDGIIPNLFPEEGTEPAYNTVDASLLLIEAVRHLIDATNDKTFLTKIFSQLCSIMHAYEHGTIHNIKMDPNDCLITAGSDGHALTWMDARVDGIVVTPRRGKPVEVNALWYAALKTMHRLAKLVGAREYAERMEDLAQNVRANFSDAFWNDDTQCLCDFIDADGKRNAQIRPNQLFALSMYEDLLSTEKQESIMKVVTEHLLTPCGLRSLSPSDPQYKPIYSGSLFDRDHAYHNGTVWGWLIGPYVSAYSNVYGKNFASQKIIRKIMKNFEKNMTRCCLGQLGEIYDANDPHMPRGCYAQAWTVAEVLRVANLLK